MRMSIPRPSQVRILPPLLNISPFCSTLAKLTKVAYSYKAYRLAKGSTFYIALLRAKEGGLAPHLLIGLSPTGAMVQVHRFIPGSTNLWRASKESVSTRYQMMCCDQAPQRPLTVIPRAFLSIRASAPPSSLGQVSGVWT